MELDIKRGILKGTPKEFKELLGNRGISIESNSSNDCEFAVTSVPMYTSRGYVDKGVVLKKVVDDYLGTTWINSKGKEYAIPKRCIDRYVDTSPQYHNIKYFYHNELNIYKLHY